MYLLDTDIVSYCLYHPENYPYLVHKISTVKQRDLYISIVTLSELFNGRLAGTVKSSDQKYPNIVQQYHYFEEMLKDVRKLQTLSFDEAAYRESEKIPASVRRGVNDKRIAGIALANNLTLVTANVRDFEHIPNLVVEDWTVRPLEKCAACPTIFLELVTQQTQWKKEFMSAELSRGIESRESNIADQSAAPELAIPPHERNADTRELSSPLIHIPLYCAHGTSDYATRYMVELLLACLDSYFAHENTYDLLVTTNDGRALEVFAAYKEKSRRRFELRLVSRDDLLSAFSTDESRLLDVPCMRTIFSKFYPILNRECDAIIHVDYDTIFVSRVDLRPLLVSDVGLVDANQFRRHAGLWCPTDRQAEFFRIRQPVEPVSSWINSGVFSVQRGGFDLCRAEIGHYLENLERAITDGLNAYTDEIIMNALAVRERDAVTVIPDYRYNFLAYYLKHDPSWTWRGQIVHFHSLKPDAYRYFNGSVEHQCDTTQLERLSEDFYLAVLMWFRHLHAACRQLAYEFPMLAAMPLEVVEKELASLVAKRDACAYSSTA